MIPCFTCGKLRPPTKAKNRDGTTCERAFCSRDCYLIYHQAKVENKCEQCGCLRLVQKSAANRRFCSYACCKKFKALSVKPRACLGCGKEFIPMYNGKRVNARKVCSRTCLSKWMQNNEARKEKISAAFKGSNHPLWQGGKSYYQRLSDRGPFWSATKLKVRERDKYKCCDCGKTEESIGRELDVHHKIPFHNFDSHKDANKLSNLEALCHACHMVKEHAIKCGKQMILPIFGSRRGHTGRARGERVYCAKLNRIIVLQLREDATHGKIDYNSVAKRLGVSRTALRYAISGKTWKSA